MRSRWAVLALFGLTALALGSGAPCKDTPLPTSLADDATAWKEIPAEGVEMHVAADRGPGGEPALRIDYDFHGHGGWAAARREIPLDLPPRYEIRFLLRGEGAPNNLEIKLVDPSGDNVWWHVDRARTWPASWTPVRVKKRQIAFAWGPKRDRALARISAIELTVSAAEGGKGTIEVAGVEIVPVPPLATDIGPAHATASAFEPGHEAAAAVDGDAHSTWRPGPAGGAIDVDLGGLHELGGVTLSWAGAREEPAPGPKRFTVALSSDGEDWSERREVTRGGAIRNDLAFPEGEARFLRVTLPADACGDEGCALAELVERPLSFGASPSDLVTALAGEAPRGAYPRGFVEGTYWTVVGVAGDPQEVLFSEDGAVETGVRGWSLEPFVRLGDRLFTWADAKAKQSLDDGDLPIPTVTWTLPKARLEVTALATGNLGDSTLLARYRLTNTSKEPIAGSLVLAARPFQVDPPYQFLGGGGGVARLARLECDGAVLRAEGAARVATSPAPASCGTLAFDEGSLFERLASGSLPDAADVADATGLASAALAWDVALDPGKSVDVLVTVALPSAKGVPEPPTAMAPDAFPAALDDARRAWRVTLGRVGLELPRAAAPLLASLRSNLAWILIHRDGPAIQPGSRAYARSWIRDGALTGVALLRLRHEAEAAEFARWFAGYQYPDGKVPCCVDRRGADPVPENDSHGELVHLVTEVYRATGDRAFAEELLPHVARAVDYIEKLRRQRRTDEYRAKDGGIFFGLLPESISHEGYSAKPMHSYWDDTFAYRGLDDAVTLATALGRDDLAGAWIPRRDQFRADLLASLDEVRAARHVAYLPGCAELADFDSTSTTTMLDPGGLLPYLPRDAVDATFERFWREFLVRRDTKRSWEAYTPYELRHVGAFLRLGAREPCWIGRAHELLTYYLRDQRPPGWNGWPEAVHRDYRGKSFLGDLPHGWVGSDFLRSTLDLLSYERIEDHALVLGAGVPVRWLAKEKIAVRGLGTPYGPLSYELAPRPGGFRYSVEALREIPPGGVALAPPFGAKIASARVDGKPAKLAADGTVVLHRLPAIVDLL